MGHTSCVSKFPTGCVLYKKTHNLSKIINKFIVLLNTGLLKTLFVTCKSGKSGDKKSKINSRFSPSDRLSRLTSFSHNLMFSFSFTLKIVGIILPFDKNVENLNVKDQNHTSK
jgi:hypothetical protein